MSMTESEVFEHIGDLAGDYKCFDEKISHQESLILCNLIEEVQQYRAIGTVEDIQSMKDNGAFSGVELAQLAVMQMRLRDYQAIGTIEEFKALKEKNVAKKPIIHGLGQRYCPVCKCGGADHFYCARCGQKLG